MKSEEVETMLKILPSYIEHHRKNPNSLIAKIFGIFTIKKAGMYNQHVMLMENCLQLKNKSMQMMMYDLKGSMFGRYTKGEKTPKTMRKDVDFLADKKVNRDLLSFSPLNQGLLGIVRRDVKYLQLKGLLDYSLLLSVEKSEETYDREKIIAKKKESDAKMGIKTKYWKGVNA